MEHIIIYGSQYGSPRRYAEKLLNEPIFLQRRLPAELFRRAKFFHLRGGMNYKNLNIGHRTMMALLYRSVCKTLFEK